MIAALFLALLAPAQAQTDCTTIANQTHCTHTGGTNDTLSENVARITQADPTESELSAYRAEGAKERRAHAYSQVGELIAKGDCTAANRLAKFYGHRDIVRDTARACPLN